SDRSEHLLAKNAGLARWAPDGRTVYFHKYVSATGGARTERGHIEDGALVADGVVFAEVVGVDAYDGFAVGPCAARPGVVFAVMSPDDTSMQPEEIRASSSEQSTGRLTVDHGCITLRSE